MLTLSSKQEKTSKEREKNFKNRIFTLSLLPETVTKLNGEDVSSLALSKLSGQNHVAHLVRISYSEF